MSQRSFRLLIVLKWLLIVVSIIVSFWAEKYLSPELIAYLAKKKNADITRGEWVFVTLGMAFIIYCFVITIGLFRFRQWAKKQILPSYVIGLLFLLLSGTTVATGLENVLMFLANLVDGAILPLVYFSPISQVFENDKNSLSSE